MADSQREALERIRRRAKLHRPLAVAGFVLVLCGIIGMFQRLAPETVVPLTGLGVMLLFVAAFYYRIKGKLILKGIGEIPIDDAIGYLLPGEDQLARDQITKDDEAAT